CRNKETNPQHKNRRRFFFIDQVFDAAFKNLSLSGIQILSMTLSSLKMLQPFVLFSSCVFLLSGCVKDTCKQTYSYKIYKPVYLTFDDLRNSVKPMAAMDLKDIGKIYYKSPYIFINEINKGIHVIDNTDPSSPQNIAFINIPGNIDMAVKDNILYADSYTDLVAIDINNTSAVNEVST